MRLSAEDRARRSEAMKKINAEKHGNRMEPRLQRPDGPLKKARYTRRELEDMMARGELVIPGSPQPESPKVIAGAYSLPVSVQPGQQLQVRYDMDGKWTEGWYIKTGGKSMTCAANASSHGHRVTFHGQSDGVIAVIENYGWAVDVTYEEDPTKPKAVTRNLNNLNAVQVGGCERRQHIGYRFPDAFPSLGAAGEAVAGWIETKERAARAGIVEGRIEVV